jgi:hypothetical protein
MSWPKSQQLRAEREWFRRTTRKVAADCGGSLISGERTAKRNRAVGGHPDSLHKDGLGEDWEFDTAQGYGKAWPMGRSLGLHGYRKPKSRGIHWQARPAKRPAPRGRTA